VTCLSVPSVVIRNGVDMTRFGGAPAGARIRSELGIAADARLVVVVSRLARLKGIEHFLQAAAALKPRYPDVRFLVVGETSPPAPAYLEELKAQARALGVERVVIFTGLRSDVPDLLGAADVSVMPSLNEALSNVLRHPEAHGFFNLTAIEFFFQGFDTVDAQFFVDPQDALGV